MPYLRMIGGGLSKLNKSFNFQGSLRNSPTAPVSFHSPAGDEVDFTACEFIKISEYIFPKDTQTNFKSKRGNGPYYGLDAVAFMFHQPVVREMPYTEYIQVSRKAGAPVVSLVDRKELIAYVETSLDDIPFVDKHAPLPSAFSSFEEASSVESKMPSEPVAAVVRVPSLRKINEPNKIITKQLRNRTTMFRTSKDFSFALEMAKKALESLEDKEQPQANVSLVDAIKRANVPTPSKSLPEAKKSAPPIIIIPASPTSLLTMYNISEFLVKSAFIPTAEAKRHSQNVKESSIFIKKTLPSGENKNFQIIDNPARLSLDDWNRVIAVFVQGQAWQFKGWKWENPVEVFQHVCGFYLHYDDSATDPSVAAWNVQSLTISRSKRHLDSSAVLAFWERLEHYKKNCYQ